MKMFNYKFLLVSIMLFFVSVSGVARADNMSYAEIENAAHKHDDVSRQALETIFGDIVTNPFSAEVYQETLLSSVFKVFNSSLLIIGVIFAAYLVMKKLMSTAHDGSIFDQQKHTFWMPIRTVLGIVCIIPTANGWCVAQLVMLWATSVMGIGIANLASDAGLKAFTEGTAMVVQPASPETKELSESLYKANLCMHSINASLTNAEKSGALLSNSSYIQQTTINDERTAGVLLRNDSYICGGATVKKPLAGLANHTAFLNMFNMGQEHVTQLSAMQEKLDKSALTFVNAYIRKKNGEDVQLPNVSLEIDNASASYEAAIKRVMKNNEGDLDSLKDRMQRELQDKGWASIGSWYQTFAEANSRANSEVQTKAKVTEPFVNMDNSITHLYGNVLEAYKSNRANNYGTSVAGARNTDEESANSSESSSILQKIFGNLGQTLLEVIIRGEEGETSRQYNPIIHIKNVGDYLMVGGEASIAALVGIKSAIAASNSFSLTGLFSAAVDLVSGGGASALKAAFEALYPLAMNFIYIIFFFGVTLSIYIPMIPFVIWFGAFINWIAVVGEAVIAAPLWAVTHLGSEGDGMGHRTGHGYIFFLNVMIRPTLMVIGFFFGGALVIVGGTLLNDMFTTAVANVQFDSTTGLFSIIGFLAVYTSMCINLIHHSFNLIFVVPDQVINWVGGHASSQLGRGDESKAQQIINAMNSNMSSLSKVPVNTKGGTGGREPNKNKNNNGISNK